MGKDNEGPLMNDCKPDKKFCKPIPSLETQLSPNDLSQLSNKTTA